MDVNDRRRQAYPMQEAKNPTDFILSVGFFMFAGFLSGLRPVLLLFEHCTKSTAFPLRFVQQQFARRSQHFLRPAALREIGSSPALAAKGFGRS